VQLVDERPQLVVDPLLVVHERAVHVRRDQADVRPWPQAGQLVEVVLQAGSSQPER
jgi:hypothetical protein